MLAVPRKPVVEVYSIAAVIQGIVELIDVINGVGNAFFTGLIESGSIRLALGFAIFNKPARVK